MSDNRLKACQAVGEFNNILSKEIGTAEVVYGVIVWLAYNVSVQARPEEALRIVKESLDFTLKSAMNFKKEIRV
jgi:hypothetical protein